MSVPLRKDGIGEDGFLYRNGLRFKFLIPETPIRAPQIFELSADEGIYEFVMSRPGFSVGDIIDLCKGYRAIGIYYVTSSGNVRHIPLKDNGCVSHIMPSIMRPFEDARAKDEGMFINTVRFYRKFINDCG